MKMIGENEGSFADPSESKKQNPDVSASLFTYLERIAKSLETIAKTQKDHYGERNEPTSPRPKEPDKPLPQPQKPQAKTRGSLGDINILFPESIEAMLTFEEENDYVIVKPRQFLGSENFSKIAAIVRDAGGEYISAGKASHFRIPR